LRSKCALVSMSCLNNNARYNYIMYKTGAKTVTATSGGVNIVLWLRVLWKIAVGFFSVVAPKSLKLSERTLTVLQKGGPKFIEAAKTGMTNPKKEEALHWDVFSVARSPSPKLFGSAQVFTRHEDCHSHIYCEIDLLSTLNFPLYTLRIPNLEEKNISPILFSVDEIITPIDDYNTLFSIQK